MTKDIVPYSESLELKELGFDKRCYEVYEKDGRLCSTYESTRWQNENPELVIGAPTFSQAFRWFREKYDISYSIDWMTRKIEYYSGYIVHFRGVNGHKLNEDNFVVLNDELPPEGYGVYKTYEEAELACLNKLIQIVKNEKHTFNTN